MQVLYYMHPAQVIGTISCPLDILQRPCPKQGSEASEASRLCYPSQWMLPKLNILQYQLQSSNEMIT
jgi:hypothetical protein